MSFSVHDRVVLLRTDRVGQCGEVTAIDCRFKGRVVLDITLDSGLCVELCESAVRRVLDSDSSYMDDTEEVLIPGGVW